MKPQVFKFPDGNGGWILKTQNEDGQWMDCDEDGKTLEGGCPSKNTGNEPKKDESSSPLFTGKRKRVSPSSGSGKPKGIQFGIKIPEELFQLVTEYVGWKGFTEHRAVHRSEVFIQGALELIRKDRDFKAFKETIKEGGAV